MRTEKAVCSICGKYLASFEDYHLRCAEKLFLKDDERDLIHKLHSRSALQGDGHLTE